MKTSHCLAVLGALLLAAGPAFATDNSTSASATNEAEASNGNGAPLSTNASNFAGFTPPGAPLSSTRNDIRPDSAADVGTREPRAHARGMKHNRVPPPQNPAAMQK